MNRGTKNCLIAKGFLLEEGVDFEMTFSPLARFGSIFLILAIIAYLDLKLYYMNVKMVFLNG